MFGNQSLWGCKLCVMPFSIFEDFKTEGQIVSMCSGTEDTEPWTQVWSSDFLN